MGGRRAPAVIIFGRQENKYHRAVKTTQGFIMASEERDESRAAKL